MKVYLRGIPHFGFVVSQETDNFPEFLRTLELRVKLGFFEAKADYYLNEKRVMVYLERDDYPRDTQLPANLYLRVSPEDGRVTGAGSGGFEMGAEVLLHVNPKNDQRFSPLLADAQRAARIKREQEEAEEERLEGLIERLTNLAEHIGIEEAVEILESTTRLDKGVSNDQ